MDGDDAGSQARNDAIIEQELLAPYRYQSRMKRLGFAIAILGGFGAGVLVTLVARHFGIDVK